MKIKIRQPRKQSISLPESYYQIPDNGTMFFNQTGEEIPPFGVFQGHDTNNTAENFPPIVIAKKPIDAAANASAIFVNGPNAVENNGFGYAQPGPLYKVLHDGTAAAGDDLGLTDDSFEASPGSGPFVAIGEDDVSENVFLCLMVSGSPSNASFFVAEEDRYRIARYWFWARKCGENGVVAPGTPYEKVYDWPQNGSRMLAHMQWGWIFQATKIDGLWYYSFGPTPPTSYNPSPSEIYVHDTGSFDPPIYEYEGQVGVPYSQVMSVVIGSHTSITATNLPPGLTYTQVTYTLAGTPTTAGDYFVRFEGEVPGKNIIRLLRITILPASDGGGDGPDPPVDEP